MSMMEEFLVSGDAKPMLTETPPVLLISKIIIYQHSLWMNIELFQAILPLVDGLDRDFDFLVAICGLVGILPCFAFKG